LTTVALKPGESQESLLRRFRKKVTQERILSDVRKKKEVLYVEKREATAGTPQGHTPGAPMPAAAAAAKSVLEVKHDESTGC
jgi:ribosomal protein S21